MTNAVSSSAIKKFLALAYVSLQTLVNRTLVDGCPFRDLLIRKLQVEAQLVEALGNAAGNFPSER